MKQKIFPKPPPKEPGVEYYNYKQYQCPITGHGAGGVTNKSTGGVTVVRILT